METFQDAREDEQAIGSSSDGPETAGARDPMSVLPGDSYGILASAEPRSLDLYRSLVQRPIEMPDRPQVLLYFLRINLPVVSYFEAAAAIRVRLAGREGFYLLDYGVDNLRAWVGNYVITGYWRKFLADRLACERVGDAWRALVVQRDGRTWASLEFSPWGGAAAVSEEGHVSPLEIDESMRRVVLVGFRKASRPFAWFYRLQNLLVKEMRTGTGVHEAGCGRQAWMLDTSFTRPAHLLTRPGSVRISTESNRLWTRLLEPGSIAPAQFVRFTRRPPGGQADTFR